MAELIGQWTYVAVFILAAIPWIEIAIVIPVAIIVVQLDPIWVGLLAFLGNWLPAIGIVYLYERWQIWRKKQRQASTRDTQQHSKRYRKAWRIVEQYGLPGLGLSAPLITGVHIATVMGVLFRLHKAKILLWMAIGLLFWTIVFTMASIYASHLFD